MKAHKSIPQLKLIKDDADLVEKIVYDHTMKSWYDDEKKREEIVKKLTEVKEIVKKLTEVKYALDQL
jgi:hypothetical protein